MIATDVNRYLSCGIDSGINLLSNNNTITPKAPPIKVPMVRFKPTCLVLSTPCCMHKIAAIAE